MSCCGQKRLAFKQELKNQPRFKSEGSIDLQPETEREHKVFEYIGNEILILRGISSGTIYHFRFKGEKLEVNYYDSFAMMAERDLKITSLA